MPQIMQRTTKQIGEAKNEGGKKVSRINRGL